MHTHTHTHTHSPDTKRQHTQCHTRNPLTTTSGRISESGLPWASTPAGWVGGGSQAIWLGESNVTLHGSEPTHTLTSALPAASVKSTPCWEEEEDQWCIELIISWHKTKNITLWLPRGERQRKVQWATIYFEGRRLGHCWSDKRWNCFKSNIRDAFEKWDRVHMGFHEHLDTILNWTEQGCQQLHSCLRD